MGKYTKILSVACNSSLIAIEKHIEAWDNTIKEDGYIKSYVKGWLTKVKNNIKILSEFYSDDLVCKTDVKKIMEKMFSYFKEFNGNNEIIKWNIEKDLLPSNMADSIIALRFNLFYIEKNCILQLERDDKKCNFDVAYNNFMYYYKRMENELLILSDKEREDRANEKYNKSSAVKVDERIINIKKSNKLTKKEMNKKLDEMVREQYEVHNSVDDIQSLLGQNFCVDGKCINCGECCSLDVALTTEESRKLRKMLKEKHINKYYKMLEDGVFKNICPFRVDGECDIYNSPSKPKICSIYICDANEFRKIVSVRGIKKPNKFMFDILPSDLKNILNNMPSWKNRNGGNK